MPGTDDVTHIEALLDDLSTRYSRVERAILGDPTVGHVGLVTRMERVEDDHRSVPEVHQKMEDRRIAGDKRLHERLDGHEDTTRDAINDIGRKVDRIIYVFVGAFLGGAGTGGGVMYAILGG